MIPIAAPHIGTEEEEAVTRVLRSGRLAQGPEVAEFEREFAALVGGRHCIAVNSGTSALHLAILASGIGPGDEVIVPSFSFAASANAVRLAGANPIFVDIGVSDFCIDPEAAADAIGPRTAAILAVHLYGHPARMSALAALAAQHGLLLIEDAAQAHAAQDDAGPVGALGDVAAFSFYPTKNMTTGEGGMVVASDPDVARRVRLLRNQGMAERYRNEIVGFNLRMTDVAAAIGRVQLARLPRWTEQRRANATVLNAALGAQPRVATPAVRAGSYHVYHQYTIRVTERDQIRGGLADRGIGSDVYYPVPIHRLPSFDLPLSLPATEEACRTVLSLPVHPKLTKDELTRVAETVLEVVSLAGP